MIYSLTGELIYLDALSYTAVVECAGVGYKLTITGNTLTKLEGIKGQVRVFTHMAVREDSVDLYGFYSKEEMDLFKLLITVSGVGPKAACSILSVLNPESLVNVIASEDSKTIAQAPGVGAKTAARVVLELHDKIAKTYFTGTTPVKPSSGISSGIPVKGNLSDARDALIVLGYSRSEVTAALSHINPQNSTDSIIKEALAILMTGQK